MENEVLEKRDQGVEGTCKQGDKENTGAKEESKEEIEKRDERNKRWEKAYAARMKEIVPGLWLGNFKASYEREMLQENNISAIVSLTDARWVWWSGTTRNAGIPEDRHKWTQCADSSTQDLLIHMSDICDFIDRVASPALLLSKTLPIESGAKSSISARSLPAGVLVHCDLGISRSPTIITAYLMRKYNAKRDDVLALLQTKQKIKPSANLSRQLQVWEEVEYQLWEDEENTVPKTPYQAFLDDRAVLLKEKGLTGKKPLAPLSL